MLNIFQTESKSQRGESMKVVVKEPKPDSYTETKLDEALKIYDASHRPPYPDLRDSLRPLIVQIYQDGHDEGMEDMRANPDDPEPPEQDDCRD